MTGVIRGEVCGLRWKDVDLDQTRLVVHQQITAVNGASPFSERTKTDHASRTIDLDASTMAFLRRQKASQAQERLVMGSGYRDRELVASSIDVPVGPSPAW